MPANFQENSLINKNALKIRDELMEEVLQLAFVRADFDLEVQRQRRIKKKKNKYT